MHCKSEVPSRFPRQVRKSRTCAAILPGRDLAVWEQEANTTRGDDRAASWEEAAMRSVKTVIKLIYRMLVA